MSFEASLYNVAKNLVGVIKEIPGLGDNHFIQWCLSRCHVPEPLHDETPWCSASLNGICEFLGLDRSYSAAARSWLRVGVPVAVQDAKIGMDIVIIKRGPEPQPGPEVLNAQGHVGIFAGFDGADKIKILGGNQRDEFCIASFPLSSVLGIRRLNPPKG